MEVFTQKERFKRDIQAIVVGGLVLGVPLFFLNVFFTQLLDFIHEQSLRFYDIYFQEKVLVFVIIGIYLLLIAICCYIILNLLASVGYYILGAIKEGVQHQQKKKEIWDKILAKEEAVYAKYAKNIKKLQAEVKRIDSMETKKGVDN